VNNFEKDLLVIFPNHDFSTTIKANGTIELTLNSRFGGILYNGSDRKDYHLACRSLLDNIQNRFSEKKTELENTIVREKAILTRTEEDLSKLEDAYKRVMKLNDLL
jgi:vacuolar-type H+-ATPase subunit I/STV1